MFVSESLTQMNLIKSCGLFFLYGKLCNINNRVFSVTGKIQTRLLFGGVFGLPGNLSAMCSFSDAGR